MEEVMPDANFDNSNGSPLDKSAKGTPTPQNKGLGSESFSALGSELKTLLSQISSRDGDEREHARKKIVELGENAKPLVIPMMEVVVAENNHRTELVEAWRNSDRSQVSSGKSEREKIEEAERNAAGPFIIATIQILGPIAAHAARALGECLSPQNGILYEHAAQALKNLGPLAKPALPQLMEHARVGNGLMRPEPSILAIGAIGPEAKEALPVLVKALRDKSDVADSVVWAITRLQSEPKEVLPVMLQALMDRTEAFGAVAWAIGQIKPAPRDALPVFEEILNGGKDAFKIGDPGDYEAYAEAFIDTLASFGEASIPLLRKASKHEDRYIEGFAKNALSALIPSENFYESGELAREWFTNGALELRPTDPVIQTLRFDKYRSKVCIAVTQFLPKDNEPQTCIVNPPDEVRAGDYIGSEIGNSTNAWRIEKGTFESSYEWVAPGIARKSAVIELIPLVTLTDNPDRIVKIYSYVPGEETEEAMDGDKRFIERAGDVFLARGAKGELYRYPITKANSELEKISA